MIWWASKKSTKVKAMLTKMEKMKIEKIIRVSARNTH
jgi:23S rRNA A2030 N6-methylase RlmJ